MFDYSISSRAHQLESTARLPYSGEPYFPEEHKEPLAINREKVPPPLIAYK